jgi:hypothetical protein
MTRAATAPIFLACLTLLSACNTTDALTPQVDVGDTSRSIRSSPVTQREAERLAGAPRQQQAFATEPQQDGYHPAYNQQSDRPGSGAPPTTMQEQADAIARNGGSPAASAPIEGQSLDAPVSNAQAEEQDMVEQPAPRAPQAPQAALPQEQTAMVSPAASRGNTVRFLPIIGAPVQAVTPLSRQLGAEARSHGLSIKSSNDSSSDYILKGYLSAFSDKGSVTVVYVWDILDNSGGRLHRIQGQESVPSAAQDPWTGVPASVMQNIASKTIAEFSSWRQGRGG